MLDEGINDLFILAVLLIIVAYFAGFTSDVNSVSTAVKGLVYASTGRDANGQFAAYPTGG